MTLVKCSIKFLNDCWMVNCDRVKSLSVGRAQLVLESQLVASEEGIHGDIVGHIINVGVMARLT